MTQNRKFSKTKKNIFPFKISTKISLKEEEERNARITTTLSSQLLPSSPPQLTSSQRELLQTLSSKSPQPPLLSPPLLSSPQPPLLSSPQTSPQPPLLSSPQTSPHPPSSSPPSSQRTKSFSATKEATVVTFANKEGTHKEFLCCLSLNNHPSLVGGILLI